MAAMALLSTVLKKMTSSAYPSAVQGILMVMVSTMRSLGHLELISLEQAMQYSVANENFQLVLMSANLMAAMALLSTVSIVMTTY